MPTPKNTSPMLYVAITTLLLVTVTIMSVMNLPFNWVFYLTVIGQVFIVFMVYKVLTDDYTTDKTFEHFYEDKPIEPVEVRADNEDEPLFR
jgi:TRAP-type C4-dicarboxylate transport system permease small subunit